jgi:hypothetical protein
MRPRQILPWIAAVFFASAVGAQSPAPDSADVAKSRVISMKSDLRNLVSAQEAWFDDHNAYADGMDGLKFRSSGNNVVRLTVTQNNGWAAEVRNPAFGAMCIIWVNLPENRRPQLPKQKITPNEGEPICEVPEP